MDRLKQHEVTLRAEHVVLRPMTEDDWDLVHKWWNDPDVSYYADANDDEYSLEQARDIVRSISGKALCFVIEYQGTPVGDCWLQEMNLARILTQNPGMDCRRVDIEIDKEFWGRGIGTEAIGLLVDFGFRQDTADAIFGCEIADYNPRSLRAFQKCGFEIYATIPGPPGEKANYNCDMVLTQQKYYRTRGSGRSPKPVL